MAIDPELTRMQVVVDARFDRFEEKLNKVVRASYGAANKIEKNFNKANFGKGLQGQLDGIARSSMLGSTALSSLGAAGLGATAVVAGLGLALKGMQASLQFADDLDAMATKLGVSAEALQALTFAAHENDVTTESLEKGLAGLNATLGAYKSGIGDARVKKVFEALGITRESLKDVNDAAAFIPILADKIKALGSTAERVKVAKLMGAEELVPLLEQGTDAIVEQTDRARELGIVMSDELAKKAADANRELEVMGEVLKGNLNIALAAAGVWVVDLTQKLGPLIKRMGDFLGLSGEVSKKRMLAEAADADRSAALRAASPNPAFRAQAAGYRERAADLRRRAAGPVAPPAPVTIADLRSAGVLKPAPRTASTSTGGGRAASSRPRFGGPLPDYIKKGVAEGRYTEASIREWYPDGNFPKDGFVELPPATTFAQQVEAASQAETVKGVGAGDASPSLTDGAPNLVRGPGGGLMSPEDALAVKMQWADAIEGGIWAAIQGGGEGAAQYFGRMFQQAMIRGLAEQLAGLLSGASTGLSGQSSGVFSTLMNLIPGFAGGTNFAPGGAAIVGENGPELVNLPRGAQVIPNNVMRAIGGAQASGRGSVTVIQPLTFNAEGAVMTEQLLAYFDAQAEAAARIGATRGATIALGSASAAQRRAFRLGN